MEINVIEDSRIDKIIAFQKDLVVWKLDCYGWHNGMTINVSEGLSSMEIVVLRELWPRNRLVSEGLSSMEMLHRRMKNHYKELVSEGLSSMEIPFRKKHLLWPLYRFRRT